MKLEFMNTTTIPEHQTLDVNSCATELGVRKETVRRLVRRKVPRRILIPKAELQRFLKASDGAIPLTTLSRSGPEKITACVCILPLRD